MRKRVKFNARFDAEDYAYLCQLARENDSSVNRELTRAVRLLRKSGPTLAPSLATSEVDGDTADIHNKQ